MNDYQGVLLVLDGTVLESVTPVAHIPDVELTELDSQDVIYWAIAHNRGEILEIVVNENGGIDACTPVSGVCVSVLTEGEYASELGVADHGGLVITRRPNADDESYLHYWWEVSR